MLWIDDLKRQRINMSFVPDELRAKAALFEERQKVYGENYRKIGPIMEILGIKELPDASAHGRFSLFVQLVTKITRYAESFNRGGHDDSLDDIAVYAMMLKELDWEARITSLESDYPEKDAPEEETATLNLNLSTGACPHGYHTPAACPYCSLLKKGPEKTK